MSNHVSPNALLDAVVALHREKDASYGNAWKKRGEVIGVMANIARKADRLENVAGGAPATADESNLDTAVDLFVYSVKYCAFLADLDRTVDEYFYRQSPDGRGSRSDGTTYIDPLLRRFGENDSNVATPDALTVTADVLTTFNGLMDCFVADGYASIEERRKLAELLALDAWVLVRSYAAELPETANAFIAARR